MFDHNLNKWVTLKTTYQAFKSVEGFSDLGLFIPL
jgi:hypothetical protein